jgi:hypothetical protein
MKSKNNQDCVIAEKRVNGHSYLRVEEPHEASISIDEHGSVRVYVNGLNILSILNPGNITITNALPSTIKYED